MDKAMINGWTHSYGAPKEWDEQTHGECHTLLVRKSDDGYHESLWIPTRAELLALKLGHGVRVTVFGAQPPIAVGVEENIP